MAVPSPLRDIYRNAGVDLAPYGAVQPPAQLPSPTTAVHAGSIAATQPAVAAPPVVLPELAMVVESLELEYAAIRKSCALLDEPQRSIVEVTGGDRIEFLNRMLTQELKGMAPYEARRSFWLNRKGRVSADVLVINLPDRVWLDVDVLATARLIDELNGYIITEDVTLRDATSDWHRLSLHGPTTPELLGLLARESPPSSASTPQSEWPVLRGATMTIACASVVVEREDLCGVFGAHVYVPASAATTVFQKLIEVGHSHAATPGDGTPPAWPPGLALPLLHGRGGAGAPPPHRVRLRLAGWHAFNLARVEAGTPLYWLDFGPESLPHESGVVRDRVSFKKGCYLGQEIVARMESRGHSKTSLVKLRAKATYDGPLETRPLPEAGGSVFLPGESIDVVNSADGSSQATQPAQPPREPVGRITSSVLSPRSGSQPICLASVKPAAAANATTVLVECSGADRGVLEMVAGPLSEAN